MKMMKPNPARRERIKGSRPRLLNIISPIFPLYDEHQLFIFVNCELNFLAVFWKVKKKYPVNPVNPVKEKLN